MSNRERDERALSYAYNFLDYETVAIHWQEGWDQATQATQATQAALAREAKLLEALLSAHAKNNSKDVRELIADAVKAYRKERDNERV